MKIKSTFSSFSVKDMGAAKSFYQGVLGLEVKETPMGGLDVTLPKGAELYIYHKEDHQPAGFTILNFETENIEEAVDELAGKGVQFERYEGFEHDAKGIARGTGPSIAWFKDPSGNILSVIEIKD